MTAYDETAAARPRGGRMPRRERRVQLLESALEVFVAQGYHAAAMDDIAERAGVSKPVLYQHFPGKLDLYLALLDASCDTIIDGCREALASTTDNKDRVAATMKVFYSYVASEEGAFRLVFESDLTSEPDVRAMCEMDSLVFGDDDAEATAQALLRRLDLDDGMELWVAETDGVIVSAGRLEPVADTEFAGLWGGATLPQWRRRGVYRALTAVRARSALALGKALVHSDSTAFSRPILERSGLVAVSTTTPYRWSRDR